jgi:osmotically-inducible protein OsmY
MTSSSKHSALRTIAVTAISLAWCVSACDREPPSGSTRTTSGSTNAADNTRVNARDQPGATALPTPTDQSNDPVDLAVTQRIRQAILGEDSLSVDAKNVKIITANGVITLRGPVKTPAERATIDSKARDLAGNNRVDDQIDVSKNR